MYIADKVCHLTEKFFDGAFNKKTNYCSKDDMLCGEFIEGKYLKAQEDIISILGKKEKYDVFDACNFFLKKYYAVQIPAKNDIQYRDTSEARFGYFRKDNDYPFLLIYDSEFLCTDEITKDGEECILLLVDLYNNKMLHEKFPVVKEIYDGIMEFKEEQKKKDEPTYYQFNTLLSITSFDRKTINSMNTIECVSPIEDINYELWFFYNHS